MCNTAYDPQAQRPRTFGYILLAAEGDAAATAVASLHKYARRVEAPHLGGELLLRQTLGVLQALHSRHARCDGVALQFAHEWGMMLKRACV